MVTDEEHLSGVQAEYQYTVIKCGGIFFYPPMRIHPPKKEEMYIILERYVVNLRVN